MAIFTPGTPVETAEPFIPVEALPPGAHTFSLVVVDEAGNPSAPAFARVEVTRRNDLVEPRVTRVQKLASPVDADHDPFGKELWVSANAPSLAAAPTAAAIAISLPKGRVAATVQIPFMAGDIAVSRNPDRRVGLVANLGIRSATLIDLAERKILFTFRLKDDADGVAVSPDGTRGLVAIPSTGQVVVLDLVDFRALAEIQVGRAPSKLRIAQEGRIAFVNCAGEGTIVGIDLRRFTVVGRFPVGGSEVSEPVQFTVTPAGFPVWSANQAAASVSAALSASRVTDIPMRFKPAAVAADESGKRAYLVGPDEDAMAFAEADAGEAKLARMPAPGGSYRSMAVTRDGRFLAVAHPSKECASFYLGLSLGPEPILRAVLKDLEKPSRVIATDDDAFFCILDPAANSISLVEISSLS